jgi:[protein-PII] uridylyltransferase
VTETYDPKGRSSQLGGPALRLALTDDADAWLQGLVGDPGPGFALVAVGGYGRRELAPGSDLDVVAIHAPGFDGANELAEKVWYPVWDAGIGLDHSIRTVDEALAVAADDLKAQLGMLDVRHVAGDPELSAELRSRVLAAWRATARKRLAEVKAQADARATRFGELAFLLEPDLKEARGGLRDVLVPWQIAAAQLVDPPDPATRDATELLRDVRGALHTLCLEQGRRTNDRLGLTDQDAVAHKLGRPDAEDLMAAVAAAGRRIAWSLDSTWRRIATVAAQDAGASRGRLLGRRRPPVREPLADGLVSDGGEVVLARDADATDPALPLRAARASAESGLPMSPYALDRLLREGAAPPEPWPAPVRDAFLALLGAGAAAITPIESLDAVGLWERYLPWWPRVRSKPQRNSFHRFTVDRHLLETVAQATALTRNVSRPDLLLISAMFHDIGKGWPGDHTDVGVDIVPGELRRLGYREADIAVVTSLVRNHLVLAETATRRDLDDPATALSVVRALRTRESVNLLRALTEADSIATGPSMWSPWKRGLLDALCGRVNALLGGEEPPPSTGGFTDHQRQLLDQGEVAVEPGENGVITVVAPDAPRLLATVAGVLALHRLAIRSLDARVDGRMALVEAVAAPKFGTDPGWDAVRLDLRRALSGALDVEGEILRRSAAYQSERSMRVLVAAPLAVWLDGASDRSSVVELRAPDAVGLLARVTAQIVAAGLLLQAARCSTLGVEVVDAFYVVETDGSLVTDPARRREIVRLLEAAATESAA